MNILNKIINFFRSIFYKKEEIKYIEEPKHVSEKDNFIMNLKVDTVKNKKKIKTLICEGDGLGIQKKMSY